MIRPVAFPSANMLPLTVPKQEGPTFAFSTLLASMKQQMPQRKESDPSLAQLFSVDSSKLYSELQQLFTAIPIEEGYVRQETLENPTVSHFLQLLPPTLKQQMTETFVPGRPFEQMVEDEKTLEDNGALLAVAFMLFQLEQRQNFLPNDVFEGVKERLVAVFSGNDARLHEQAKNVRSLLDKLISLSSKNEQVAAFSSDFTSRSVRTAISSQAIKEPVVSPKEEPLASLKTVIPLPPEPLTGGEESIPFFATNKELAPVISLPANEQKGEVQRSFTHQLTEIMKAGKFTKGTNGQAQLVIRLHPEHLGTLTVKLIVQKDGELAAKIVTNTTAAKELVEASIHQIRHIIPTENITVERFDVWTQPEFAGMNRHHQQHQSKQPFEQERQAEKAEHAAEEFADTLNEALNTTI